MSSTPIHQVRRTSGGSPVRRNHRLRLVAAIGAAGLVLAACGSGDSATPTGGGTTSGSAGGATFGGPVYKGPVGQGEGKLTVLAWPGYAEDGSTDKAVDWVTPFEKETGCQVDVKVFATSNEAVQLFNSGGYDVVSASGDASLRLVYGDKVQPIDTKLVPNYADVIQDLKNKPWNTEDGVNYGVPDRSEERRGGNEC